MFVKALKQLLERAGFEGEDLDLLRQIRDQLKLTNLDIDVLLTIYLSMFVHMIFGVVYLIRFPIWTWLISSLFPTLFIWFITKWKRGAIK